MSLRIQTNIEAFDAHRNLVNTENQLSTAMERLSSGFRINKAADDAAGLAISREAAVADRRPRPGPAQRAGRRLARADG